MATNSTAVCPKAMAATSNGVWQGDKPVDFALPLLILQICLVLFVTRALAFLLTPLKQPRVIAEIIGGILLGPSALGRNTAFKNKVFPTQSITLLETVADLGLLFFLFLVGLELDLVAIRRTGKQAMSIAAAGITLPFIMGVGVSWVLQHTIGTGGSFTPFMVFMGVALSITAFPVLARILAELRLLTTDVGQMAMSAAAVNDIVAWVLLALAVALSGSGKSPLTALWVLLCGVAYVAFLFLVVKPLIAKMAGQVIENEPVNEMYVALTLAGVLMSGFVTDAIGIHAIFGGFLFGLIIPKDSPFAAMLIEKLEDFVSILMLPLYFAVSGLKTNIGSVHGAQAGGLLVLVITVACIGKITGTFVVSFCSKMGFRKSLALGFLMNTKGLVELIVLNIGKDRKVLNDEIFAIMVLMALFTTFITTPIVVGIYKPARRPVPYTRRTVYAPNEKAGESELRMLACLRGMPYVHATINLVEAIRGMRRRPLHLYILQLVELSERTSAIMDVQRCRRDGRPFDDKQRVSGMDRIIVAFEAFGQLSKVIMRPMKAISHFNDMHKDVCATAEDKRTSIIILPFYKYVRQASNRDWGGQSSGLQHVTQKVLLHAPCSVGILVDRGIGLASHSSSAVKQQIAVLFYGGPDDREALAIGYRMAEHPGVTLAVFRFVSNGDALEHQVTMPHETPSRLNKFSKSFRHSGRQDTLEYMTADTNWDEETKLDEQSLALAKGHAQAGSINNSGNSNESMGVPLSIKYEEREIAEPVEEAIRIGKMESWSLLLVGNARRPSQLIRAFAAEHSQTEYSELGLIGAALTKADLNEIICSVLVVQQYDMSLAMKVPPSSKVMDTSRPKSASGLLTSKGTIVVTGPAEPSPDVGIVGEDLV